MAAAVAMNCRARKNSRPIRPMSAPTTVSETMRASMASGATCGRAARSTGTSSGDSASVTATAMNRRTCTGTRALEKPGISMRQPPMRQKARNTSSTVSAPMSDHEMVPSDLICTPRAISTWERTGSVANSRSVTMRT